MLPMDAEPIIRIARDGEELGAWNRFEIRQFLAAGSLVISDQFFDENDGGWHTLIPVFRRKTNIFDWGGEDDRPFYYISEGYIIGPRLAGEIDALFASGYLSGDTWVAFVGGERWFTIAELNNLAESENQPSVGDHAGEAFSRYVQGDKIGAAMAGFKAVGSLWKEITKPDAITSKNLSVWTGDPSYPGDAAIVDFIVGAGFPITKSVRYGSGKATVLGITFPTIEIATAARDTLEGKDVTPTFSLFLEQLENQAVKQD